MREAIPPLPHTPSWLGVQLKHRDNYLLSSPANPKQLDGYEANRNIDHSA